MKKVIFRVLKVLVLLYALSGIVLYYLQDKIFFHPVALPPEHRYDFPYPYKEVNIPYSSTSNINIIQFLQPAQSPKGVVLYFHGNKHNTARYAEYAPLITEHNYEVWMIDYPGYGKSTGNFHEQTLFDWSLQLYKLARARYQPDEIIIYGKSLGTGIAAQLASIRDCRSLVLETPYYSFPSILASYAPFYPLNNMIRFKIPTWKYLQRVTAPVTIFHGTADWTIPLRNSRKLLPYLKKGDEFIVIKGGQHNTLTSSPLYTEKLKDILKE